MKYIIDKDRITELVYPKNIKVKPVKINKGGKSKKII